jgi:hypothetical protein
MYTVFRGNQKLLQTKEPTNNSFAVAFGFQETGIIFSLKDGTHVLKHVGEAHLMFVLIKNVYLVGTIKVYIYIKKMHGMDRFKIICVYVLIFRLP